MGERLLLIDASSSIFRAFYALPALSNARGVPTNATLGFLTMLQKLLRERSPDYAVVVWDAPGAKRRKTLYPEYKATRDATPEDLRAQFPYIRRGVDGYRLAAMEFAGEEADDVIATLSRQAVEQGIAVEIASSDKDLMQLVSGEVTLLDTARDREFGPAEVEKRFGVPPERVLDLRSLIGDSSDNIPGVRGIGEKGAAKLIQEYGSLEAAIENAAGIKAKRTREALLAGVDDARLSRELSRLRDDLPVVLDREAARIGEPDRDVLVELFRELELVRLLDDLEQKSGPVAPAEREPDVPCRIVSTDAEFAALAAELAQEPCIALRLVLQPEVGMTGELLAIALACDERESRLIDLRALDEAPTLEALRPLFADPERSWLGFDLKRDWLALARRGLALAGELRDVSLAAYVVDPAPAVQRPEVLARVYLEREFASEDEAFGKGAKRRAPDGIPPEELGAFYGTQLALARALDRVLGERLDEAGQRALCDELERPLGRVLGRMELAGVHVDANALRALSREIEGDLERIEAQIFGLAGGPFKINSPKQLQEVLFEKLALPPSKRTKTGFSTDESVLEELAIEHDIARAILDWRRLQKLRSTYVDTLPELVDPTTGRIHCVFQQTVAATGRLSAANPNLQNIPVRTPQGQRIRATFVSEPGMWMLSADYSQIELRILAHCSEDAVLLEAFRTGDDIHVRTASQVFDVEREAVTAEQRSQVKAINFGIIYGSSAFGIARQLGISQSDAAAYIKAYFARYPGVRRFLDQAIEQARERGFSETLWGRRRYLPDLHSRNRVIRSAAERMATNSVLQGTAADLIKRAMLDIDDDLRAPGAPRARMILQVHDELLFEVRPEDAGALRERVVSRMQEVAQLRVPLEVHVGQGGSWLEAH